MKKILLVYAPFCTPASPPYSIAYLHSFLKDNGVDADTLDLNSIFHNRKWPEWKDYFQHFNVNYSADEYNEKSIRFVQETKKVYNENNKKIVSGDVAELVDDFVSMILVRKPEIVAFSIVYSSQAFYTKQLLVKLREKGVRTVVGGPCVNSKLVEVADAVLNNEVELLEFVSGEKYDHMKLQTKTVVDLSMFDPADYFTPARVVPIRTAISCYYRQCAFCTHHGGGKYMEYPLENIELSIMKNNAKFVFFIDDMISLPRLLKIAKMLRGRGVYWTCQLRPTKDHTPAVFKELYESGCRMLLWGVESGSQKILDKMRKGTNVSDVAAVLRDSHDAGILNVTYIMFGFPGETKEDFLSTISFLQKNTEYVDLVSTTVFGLQKGAPMFEHPDEFGITKISFEERTVLEPKISYTVSEGLSNEEASSFRTKYKRTLEKMNKYPKTMNFFREHMLILITRNK